MKLLVVEDNARLAERITEKLHKLHSVDVAENGHEVMDKVSHMNYAVIILDLGLPDMTGLEICRQLRKQSVNTPILILTGNGETDSKVDLLNEGADDYMTKPFNTDELKARVKALGRRRSRLSVSPELQYLDLKMDVDQRIVTRAGQMIYLRRKEFDILEYLLSNQGRVLTREMIMNHVWDADKTSWLSTVDVHIKHLRDKIDRQFEIPIIKTVYGLGYRADSLI
ncbi:MAG: DNA-binding response regulator [Candidatus Saccharibacteria bacterium]|nr:DNA-binding response regulator [Candidatus Saccharibacteria bacterium]